MTIHEQIKEHLKEALRAKDEVRLRTVRGLLSAFTNELVAKKMKPSEILPDADALSVIKRSVKQRKDSMEQFEKGGRPELVEVEKAELAVLEKYLPQTMSRGEIRPVAEAKMKELGVTDKSKAGQLIGAIKKELGERADGGDIKAVVDELFS